MLYEALPDVKDLPHCYFEEISCDWIKLYDILKVDCISDLNCVLLPKQAVMTICQWPKVLQYLSVSNIFFCDKID